MQKLRQILKQISYVALFAAAAYLLVISSILDILEFPFYPHHFQPRIIWNLLWIGIYFGFAYLFFPLINKQRINPFTQISKDFIGLRKNLKNRKRAGLIWIVIIHFAINFFYPSLLESTQLFTTPIITQGTVVNMKESHWLWRPGRFGSDHKIPRLEIIVIDQKQNVQTFELSLYKNNWDNLKPGDIIMIKHYPLIHDHDLEIVQIKPTSQPSALSQVK